MSSSRTRAPTNTGCISMPISPMSCWNGSQLRNTVDAVCSKAFWISDSLAIRFWWLTMTPRGAPVEPDEYCRMARSSMVAVTSSAGASRPSSSSTAMHGISASSGTSARAASNSRVVSTTWGCASATIARSRGNVWASRDGIGTCAGTAHVPAIKAAEQRVEKRCVLWQQQQRARLIVAGREFTEGGGDSAGAVGELTPGLGGDTAAVLEERECAVVRAGVSMLLQSMRDRRALRARIRHAEAGQIRHRAPQAPGKIWA